MAGEQFSLKGKAAIVAGDGGWSGAVALALAEAGADVALAGRSATGELQDAVAKIQGMGRKAVALAADLTSAAGAQSMVEGAVAGLGRVDILVNYQDLKFAKPLLEVTDEEWQRVMKDNLTLVFQTSRAVGRRLVEQKGGKVINIVSGLAERGMANCTAYCAAMGGVLQLTRALALEWAREGIRVNAIGTGWLSDEEISFEEAQKDPLVRYIPVKQKGKPMDLGGLVVYLASDASDYMTGHILFVDGGVMAHA